MTLRYDAPMVRTVGGRLRCRYVMPDERAPEQCKLPMRPYHARHRFTADARAEQAADLRARLAAAAERDGPGSFFADLLTDHDARAHTVGDQDLTGPTGGSDR